MTEAIQLCRDEAILLLEASEGLAMDERRRALVLCQDAIAVAPTLSSRPAGQAALEAAALLLGLEFPGLEPMRVRELARACESIVLRR